MKKGWLITFSIVTFVVGALYGVSSGSSSLSSEEIPSLVLDEQIEKYEQVVADGKEFVPSYSEQSDRESIENDKLSVTDDLSQEVVAQKASSIQEINHNAVSRFGQNMGEFLKNLVREVLRAIVKFVDKLIDS